METPSLVEKIHHPLSNILIGHVISGINNVCQARAHTEMSLPSGPGTLTHLPLHTNMQHLVFTGVSRLSTYN